MHWNLMQRVALLLLRTVQFALKSTVHRQSEGLQNALCHSLQNKGLAGANQALKAENDADRAKAQAAIDDLEKKLTELQNQLMNNSKEFSNTREAQASLRNEIDTYRILLDQEARRYAPAIKTRATML